MPPNNQMFNQPVGPQGAAPAQPPSSATPQLPVATPLSSAPVAGSGVTPEKLPPRNPNSTQNTLLLSEVREDMVVMADGSFRAVVACKPINFDLMSDREREGVEYSYQNFLNSLNFPIQILVRSRQIDIGPYIEKLIALRRSQDNMLLGVLMDDYVQFIDILSQEANIMEKTFYIVIPYFPQGEGGNFIEQGKGFFSKLLPTPKNAVTKIDAATWQKAKEQIKNRVDTVMSGLFQIGVQSVQLDTKSLAELYYSFYNPDTALRQPIGDYDKTVGVFTKKAAPGTTAPGGTQ